MITANADLAHSSPELRTPLDRRLAAMILDPRDVPFLHLIAGCLAVAAFGVALFFSGPWVWYPRDAQLAARRLARRP